ncbi:hypothetical protein [Actinomadura sediminis]|uniref:Abi-like protein n=1 Tax=Actinomadura sediminis TaxID=1038904 RepID=A0ABW3EVR4_9ACTN
MRSQPPVWLDHALSRPRLAPYIEAAGGDAAGAWKLYCWNIQVSAAFYGPLHCLEVSLRNSLNDRLKEAYGRTDWWTTAPLSPNGNLKVAQARENAQRNIGRGRPLVPDDVVAELTFGFWVGLLSRHHDRNFWVPTLHRSFPHFRGRRNALHHDFFSMLLFRNRVMHYEPIHHRDLDMDHRTLYRLLEYIGPEFAAEARRMDRVPSILQNRLHACSGDRTPSF